MVMVVALLLPALVQAGGLSLYEIGTEDGGLASVWWAAPAPAGRTTATGGGGSDLKIFLPWEEEGMS